jgi:hypothetical protein
VQNLWTNGEFPVDGRTRKKFFDKVFENNRATMNVDAPSWFASLDARCKPRRITSPNNRFYPSNVTAAVHRFEEIIGGRPYLIEVKAVSPDRWRAYIVRIPGVPTALMPFYGRTPDEAAHQLSDWLTRAYARIDRQSPTS